MTSDPTEIPLLPIEVGPEQVTGLSRPSNIMVDKVTTMSRSKLGDQIGIVSNTTMLALSRALIVFLGMA